MSLTRILLISCIIFVCIIVVVTIVTKVSFRQTIGRNIKFMRLFWNIVNLWRDKKFLTNLSQIDEKTLVELNRDDVELEIRHLSSTTDRSLRECLTDAASKNNLSSTTAYERWWRKCVTTRTRIVEVAQSSEV